MRAPQIEAHEFISDSLIYSLLQGNIMSSEPAIVKPIWNLM
jgi:hypothetical protein